MPKPKTQPAPSPSRLLNRELSWLEFNQRVLDEALNERVPLLERVKFFCITNSNLDEFFEVRVAGLRQERESEPSMAGPDGLTAAQTLNAVLSRVRRLVDQAYTCWREQLVPALAGSGIQFLDPRALDDQGRAWLADYFRREVGPVLTPLAFDPAHPFPQLLNKAMNLVVRLEETHHGEVRSRIAFVQVPRVLPRLVELPSQDNARRYLFLGKVIAENLATLFPGTKIQGSWIVRVTRNGELYIDEEETSNLLKAVENELRNRRRGEAVRLEVERDCPPDIRAFLLEQLNLTDDDLFVIDGPLNPTRLMTILEGEHDPELHDSHFVAPVAPALQDATDLFTAIRQRDVLLHHPYDNFDSVVLFLQNAAADPRVLAIKQTLYRTGGDARLVGALMDAARNGKQVTAVVELKARFDEANNIQWARRLEEAGVHVVYGMVGYKIHCKALLVVRRDEDGLRRYVHLSTGNYNPSTARLYTDVGLLTCRPDIGEDVTELFNLLTGICQFQPARRLIVAPFDLHRRMLELVDREIDHARRGLPARIILKLNALVDETAIEALYKASQAGVTVDLIIRGICCLRPGIPGLSDRITVRSIVDRFLEHSRIYFFENAGRHDVYISSADWMPRNFFRRIEVAVPIVDGNLTHRILDQILQTSLGDTVKARFLQPDGSYRFQPAQPGAPAVRSQTEFIRMALEPFQTARPKPPKAMRLRPRPALPPSSRKAP